MRALPSLLTALFLLLGSPGNLLLAADFFVVNSGAPTGGDGSAGNPWGTITEAFNSGSLAAGDVVNVAAGTYNAANGEAFPLTLPDGVRLEGAGVDLTSIDGSGVGTRVILHPGNSQPSGVFDVEIVAGVGATAGISVPNNITTFDVQSCRILGGQHAIDYLGFGSGAPTVFRVANNTIATNSGRAVFFDHNVLQGGIANDVTFKFTNNTVVGSGNMTYGVVVDFSANNLGRGVAIVEDNTFDGLTNNAIQAAFRSQAGYLIGDFQVRRNTVTSCKSGVNAWYSAISSGTGNAEIDIADNVITDAAGNGIVFGGWAGFFTTVWYDGMIRGNTVTGAAAAGFRYNVSTTSSAFAFPNLSCSNNLFESGEEGIEISHFGWGFGISSNNVFRSNVVAGNAGDGISIGFSSSVAGGELDFGRAGDPGLNTITGNAAGSASSIYDVQVEVFNGFAFGGAIHGRGNFWGTKSLIDIEDRIYHAIDSSTYEEFDYAGPLSDTLRFRVADKSFAPAPGRRTAVRAHPSTRFVPYAGNRPIEVLVNGVPAIDPVVSADRRTLKFTLPALSSFDGVSLKVTNPGGQTGTAKLFDRTPPGGTYDQPY